MGMVLVVGENGFFYKFLLSQASATVLSAPQHLSRKDVSVADHLDCNYQDYMGVQCKLCEDGGWSVHSH